jgi:hypothetical protein
VRGAERLVQRHRRVVEHGQHLAYAVQAEARHVDQGPDQAQPPHVLDVVRRPGGTACLAARQQALAQVELDRRDRDSAALGQLRHPHEVSSVAFG